MATWFTDVRRRAVIVLLATVVGMVVTARLGVWQLDRAAQKEALQAALDVRGGLPPLGPSLAALPSTEGQAAAQHYRPVRLYGEWMQGSTVFLENRQMNGQPGFFVLTPLMLGAGDALLVQRGWFPRNMQDRTQVPNVPTPNGRVDVQGQISPAPGRLFEFAGAASGVIRQNLALDDFSRELGVTLRPWTVLQADGPGTVGDGLLRQWPRPAADIHKHYGYAFQWFALCALMAGLYVWFQLLRPRLS
jgi:surfeit locus 1 family protein